ncbi:hypothetical protein [Curtobacterium sp. MCBA15_004]|uniref:hypothetical protein n=1 Tax=Curtobacterium sp. MCBA15_004 TaxID=1898733 RepID=UPI0008DE8855|nr:hypothetical protein [Curtobacterium sp. MCBA15_004]WIA95840.1 hypothetical protein QOL16_12045 [Curtobacterium sp. MCBA15_004]
MTEPQQWYVHILGPDDIEGPYTIADAFRFAAEVNEASAYRLDSLTDESFPAWAVPTRSPLGTTDHEPQSTGLPQPMNLTKAEQESFLAAMQDQQPTVQVPVSLIEQIERDLGENAWHPEDCPGSHPAHCTCAVGQARRALRALLSQPTPTVGYLPFDERAEFPVEVPVEPPRIEDMAPGTLFWAKDGKGVWRRLSKTNASVTSVVDLSTGRHFPAIHIDPSTIRDVTPPAVSS